MDIRQVPGNVSAGSSSACLLPCRRLRSAPRPARGKLRPGAPLAAALAAGLVVRVLRLLRDPLIHPDGPAYLELARALLHGKILAVLGGDYSPLYPAAVAGLAATGLRLELAGRATALLAGLAALPFLHQLVRRCAGERAADAAVLVAAVHPALVKASAQVLPETLAGALLLAWLVVRRAGVAGALAGAAYLARPEGVLLLPLGLWRLRRARLRALVLYAGAAVAVMAPALIALRAETGHWQFSPREARIALLSGVPGATTIAEAALRNPAALLARLVEGMARQVLYDATALGPLLVIPFVLGLGTARRTRGPLAVAAWFTALPLALNPSPRYAVPLVPLLLPATAAGLLAIGERLGRHARLVTAALGVALVVQALWVRRAGARAAARACGGGLVLSGRGGERSRAAGRPPAGRGGGASGAGRGGGKKTTPWTPSRARARMRATPPPGVPQ